MGTLRIGIIDLFHWSLIPPKELYIVTGFYPEKNPKEGGPAHRPLLVLDTHLNIGSGAKFVCLVTYGTKNINSSYGGRNDIIINNLSYMNKIGLKYPTRFMMSEVFHTYMPWISPYFEPWINYETPMLFDLNLL